MDTKFRIEGWGDPTHKVTWHLHIVVTWQIENIIFPLSQDLWIPNLARWWLLMRGPHLQSHVTHQSRGRVSSQNVLSPHSQGPRAPKRTSVLNQGEGAPTQKVTWHFNCVVTWKIQTVIFPQPQGRRDVKGKLKLVKNKHKKANKMLRWSRSWLI